MALAANFSRLRNRWVIRTPTNAVWLGAAGAFLLGLPYLWNSTAYAAVTSIAVIGLYIASLVLNWGARAFGFSGPADIGALPLFGLTMGLFGLLTMPLNNAYSRWREVRADTYALEATHKPQAFINAMTRLANQNLADADPEPWVVFLLYSHPPIRDRVAMAASPKFKTVTEGQ